VWIDRGDIHAGAEWQRTIARAIEDCLAFIFVVSPDSVDSQYAAHEFSLATAHKKTIFPLIYRKTKIPKQLEQQLFDYQFIDFRKGSYADNFTDLLTGLVNAGVPLISAPELTPEEQAERRRELLGVPDKVEWSAVLRRIPGWALAWGIGWGIYWLILPIVLSITGTSGELDNFIAFPIGGFFGGLIGGLWAGLVTMLALRHHASSIAWKHMKSSIRIWGLIGSVGTIVVGGLAYGIISASLSSADCSGMSVGDCFGAAIGQGIANAIGLIIGMVFYSLIALFVIGCISGGFAVRHIRRLEPGILGKQAIWVILGWGSGAVLALLASFIMMAPFME
jgi:hypothetical protein